MKLPSLSRIGGGGESPLLWAVPLGRPLGVRLGLHTLFVVWLVAQLISAIRPDRAGLEFALPPLVLLLVLVVLHEAAHVCVARRLRLELSNAVLWPLGGVTPITHAKTPRQQRWVAFAGPVLHAGLAVPLGLGVVLLGGPASSLVFWPIAPSSTIAQLAAHTGVTSAGLLWVWWAYAVNMILLLANLLPAYPLDAARIVEASIWRRRGREAAAVTTGALGMGVGAGLIVIAAVLEAFGLMALGAACAAVSYLERRTARAVIDLADPLFEGPPPVESVPEPDPEQAEARATEQELDRILAKISAEGMEALTRAERRLLDRARAER
ncbi:MAG: site-2 protease family protein [Planctomycetota bacterium]